MPYADYGESIDMGTSKFTKLKSKGDKIRFRLLGKPFYDGKHFMQDDGEWDIKSCPRINEGGKCDICDMFFKAHKDGKKQGLSKDDIDKMTKDFKASVSFYFPVVNRETEMFEIFQTTIGVRNQLETEKEMGVNLLESDFVVMRTEIPGSYYKLSKVDSSDVNELSEKELAAVEEYEKVNLEEYINGKEEDIDVDEF